MPVRQRHDAEPESDRTLWLFFRRVALINLGVAVGGVVGCFLGGLFGWTWMLGSNVASGYGVLEFVLGGGIVGAAVIGGLYAYLVWEDDR
jgi:hypothetical protein